MNLMRSCLSPCPSITCEALGDIIQNYITALKQYNTNNPGSLKYIPESFDNIGLDEYGSVLSDELMNYHLHGSQSHSFERPWTAMASFVNDLMAEINSKFSNAPFCVSNLPIDYIANMLRACNPAGDFQPKKNSPCNVCYTLNTDLKLSDFQDYLNQVVKGDAGINNTGQDKFDVSNWLLMNSPKVDITTYYNSNSTLYQGGNNPNKLRYFTPYGYPVPPALNATVTDNTGHTRSYSLYFPGDETYFHWGEIVKFSNIQVQRTKSCLIPEYFVMDALIWISEKEYQYFHASKGITLGKTSITVNGIKEFGYYHTIKITGRFNNVKLSKKVKCPGPCYTLCNRPITPQFEADIDCNEEQKVSAYNNALIRFNSYIKEKNIEFEDLYFKKCLGVTELFKASHNISEYHYTLYYFDRAGSMVKTIPPEGVDVQYLNQTQLTSRLSGAAQYDKLATNFQMPDHNLISYNQFSVLGSVLMQESPDAGIKRFWYDKLGRLVASQNAKQYALCKPSGMNPKVFEICSYTKYDALGRIIEMGEKNFNIVNVYGNGVSQALYPGLFANTSDVLNTYFYNYGNNSQITKIEYDNFNGGNWNYLVGNTPSNLRKNIARSLYFEDMNSSHSAASYYSYDAHGNLKTFWQEIPGIKQFDEQFIKRFDYQYDLISGNLKKSIYQEGKVDQWVHRYAYDADLRLSQVETSKDQYIWQKDAQYKFLKHGPLSRIELGDQKVQGVDYAYTLQGWMKNVNSDALQVDKDMGKDGHKNPYYNNNITARDAFGFSLQYFEGDYLAIEPNVQTGAFYSPLSYQNSSDLSNKTVSLYNGNISQMITTVPEANAYNANKSIVPKPLATAYRYDQLNRLIEVAAFDNFDINNSWKTTWLTGLNQYSESFNYDGNGNILKATRKGNLTGVSMAMDNFEYQYSKNGLRLQNNKLNYVTDLAINSGNYADDVDNQNSNNYNYDEIGNLIKDEAEEIENIEWNLYGKIKKITRKPNSSKADLEFTYNAGGQRLSKTVKPRNNGVLSNQKDWKTTWYVRDAGGNPVATYIETYAETQSNGNNYLEDKLTLLDFNIAGAGRLGIANANLHINTIKTQFLNNQIAYSPQGAANLTSSSSTVYIATISSNKTQFYLGNKNYELSNHLGNVLAVVSDRKHLVDDGVYDPNTGAQTSISLDNLGDYFVPEYQSFGLYYAYGAAIPGSTYATSNGQYRFGFNGMEKTNEVFGSSNEYTTEFRQLDSRLGRWFSKDLIIKYWESPYALNFNNPIKFVDPNGLDPEPKTKLNVFQKAKNFFTLKAYINRANKIAEKLRGEGWVVNENLVEDYYSRVEISAYKGSDGSDYSTTYNEEIGVNEKVDNSKIMNSRKINVTERINILDRGFFKLSGSTSYSINTRKKFFNEPKWMQPGHTDAVHDASDVSGMIISPNATIYGANIGLVFGVSRTDGFNLGITLPKSAFLDVAKWNEWGVGVSVLSASGEFTWENYSEDGVTYNLGSGPVSYTYSRNGRLGDTSPPKLELKGLTFGINGGKINASINASYTIMFF